MTTDSELRAAKVKLLLETVDEPYPTATISAALLAALPGIGPGSRVPCSFCLRSGRIVQGDSDRYCPLCMGYGWRRRRAGEDPWDEMTGRPIRDQASAKNHSHAFRLADDYRRITSDLARVEVSIAQQQGEMVETPYRWETEVRRYCKAGSYVEMLRALSVMALARPFGHAILRLVYLSNLPGDLIRFPPSAELAARVWLGQEMRGAIRVPSWVEEPLGVRKRQSVGELAAAGLSATQIARVLGVTKQKARRLINECRPMALA